MKNYDSRDENIVDLGAVTLETRGALPAGQDDVQPGEKFILGGIGTDD